MPRFHTKVSRGFTLIEMMVIAPIVILLIGAFIALIVNLTGEVMSSRGSNVLAYNVQDALNRIEDDVKLSTTYLAVNNINVSTTKQGYGMDKTAGSTVNFTNVDKSNSGGSHASLILNSLVTDGNPVSSQTGLVYLANKPNSCDSYEDYSKNTPMTMNVVYFVDENDTLWRRVIMPPDYAQSSTYCGTSAPWQLPTCINGYSSALTFCKSSDEKLIEGVGPSDFVFQYYSAASSTTPDSIAANGTNTDDARNTALQSTPSLSVSITARQTIAGRDITRSGNLRVTRLDSNATSIAKLQAATSAPATPVVSATVSDGHNVTFTWPRVAGATSYSFDYRLNSGSWVTGSANLGNNERSYTVTNGTHTDVVEGRVRASNSFGPSGYGSTSLTIPLWAPLVLKGNWTDYGSTYSSAAYTKTKSGLVLLRGLVKNPSAPGSGNVIGTLPAEYAPSATLIYGVTTGNGGPNDPGRIDVDSDGNVIFNTGNASSWISLEPVRFLPANTTYTWNSPSLINGWVNYGGSHANAAYTQMSTGRVVTQGLVKSGTITDGTDIFTLPASYAPPLYLHMGSRSTTFAHIGIVSAGAAVEAKGTGTNGYLAVNSTYIPSGASGVTWTNLTLQNSWVNYGGSFSTAQYTKTSDNLVQLKGLIKSGSTTYDSTIATLPAGFRPKTRLLYTTVNGAAHARVDIYPDGRVNFLGTTNTWFALDDIVFVAEQ